MPHAAPRTAAGRPLSRSGGDPDLEADTNIDLDPDPTMIIATDNDDLAAVGDAAVRDRNDGEPVEFNDDGRARVRAELGELLVESRDGIEVVDDERRS